jgi:hypothetical protein
MAEFWNSIPQILDIIREERNPQQCFANILALSRQIEPSEIWASYTEMNFSRDILAAKARLKEIVSQFPDFNGICIGLDTLNWEGEGGYNVQIAMGNTCDPASLDQEWCFDCFHYGEEHLIESLAEVGESFTNEEQWNYEERSAAEYIIFLGYSGIVFREALRELKCPNDFGTIWGFHDGDMFNLVRKIGDRRTVVAE